MPLTYELFESCINDLLWRNEVARLLGSGWDLEGNQVINLICAEWFDRWGERGMYFIDEFLAHKTPYVFDSHGEKVYAFDVKSLYTILNKFFLLEEDE